MRKLVLGTAALLAAVFCFLVATLPPAPARIALDGVDAELRRRTIAGAFHVHTTRSDGAGSREEVAAAAARAGLQFVVLADHGDGTRPLDPPAYLNRVLCVDGVEISTTGGHYVAVDMQSAPYPLGGEPAAVVEDVRRLGGFGVVAHPDHQVNELSWKDWNAPFDGLELINAAAEWQDERLLRRARAVFDYLVRPGATLGSLLDRPVATLERWDTLEKNRPVVGLAAVDAHGSAQMRIEGIEGFGLGPSYEASFRSLSNRVILDRPLSGDPIADSRQVIEAIRAGRTYSVIDSISPDVVLNLSTEGHFEIASSLPAGARPYVFTREQRQRIEVHSSAAPGRPPVPWVLSNWGGPRGPSAQAPDPSPILESVPLASGAEWRVEKDLGSSGRISSAGSIIVLEYKLRSETRESQFVAAVADLNHSKAVDAIVFNGHATRPMRVSLQLRFGPDGGRWRRSVYLDPVDRAVRVDLSSMVPAEPTAVAMPAVTSAQSILFVVDLVNARPGDGGGFTISALRGVR